MKQFEFTLKGITPLIMHNDDIQFADDVDRWQSIAKQKSSNIKTVPGDDRFPSWKWTGYLYRQDGRVGMPAANLIRAMIDAGKFFSDPTAKSKQTTLKKAAVTQMVIEQDFLPLSAGGKPIDVSGIEALESMPEYGQTKAWAHERGIGLLERRATVGSSKHVRVRPWFHNWTLSGGCTVMHPALSSAEKLAEFLDVAGMMVGLGDWRPSSPRVPGIYGRFKSQVSEVRK